VTDLEGLGELDNPVRTLYTPFMAPPQLIENTVPAHRRPADRPTTTLGVRIYKDQIVKLDDCYEGNSSALVRFLLDKYFNNEFPTLVKEFHNSINK
jgi:hypothetical protein